MEIQTNRKSKLTEWDEAAVRQLTDALGCLCTFHSGFMRREDPGVSTGRSADVKVELNVVL